MFWELVYDVGALIFAIFLFEVQLSCTQFTCRGNHRQVLLAFLLTGTQSSCFSTLAI